MRAFAGDEEISSGGSHGNATERFARRNVGDVDLGLWERTVSEGVGESVGIMCEGPGIDNDGVGGRRSGPGFLNSVDQASLMVALEIFKLNVWESLADASDELREGFRAIKGRVASTKHIEVRAVEDKKFHIAGESDNSGNEKEQQET